MYTNEVKNTSWEIQDNGYDCVKVTIGWTHYLVPKRLLPSFVEMMSNVKSLEGDSTVKDVEYNITKAPDVQYELLKAKATEEIKDTLVKEKEQYSKWWLDERAKTQKLEKEMSELKATLSRIETAVNPVPEQNTPF